MSLKSACEALRISRSGQYRKEKQRRALADASFLGIQADDSLAESSRGSFG